MNNTLRQERRVGLKQNCQVEKETDMPSEKQMLSRQGMYMYLYKYTNEKKTC